MKVALCLSGKVGGVKGKDGRGDIIDFELCYDHYKQHLLDRFDCDIFYHTWSIEQEKQLKDLYQPCAAKSEKQIQFSPPTRRFCLQSKWYSNRASTWMKRQHEHLHNFKYDWVIVSRFDLMLLRDIPLNEIDSGFLYLPNLALFPKHTKRPRWHIPPKVNVSRDKNWLHDIYLIGNSRLIDKLVDDSSWFLHCSKNPHKALWSRVYQIIGPPHKVIKFWGYRGHEFDLYRWRICHSER